MDLIVCAEQPEVICLCGIGPGEPGEVCEECGETRVALSDQHDGR